MRKILLFIFCCVFLLSSANADIYSELEPGVVSVTAQETIPFRTEPKYNAEPLRYIGSGVNLTLLSVDEENNWAHVQLETGPDGYPIQGYVRPGALMNGDYLYWNMCRVLNPESNHRLNLRSEPSVKSASLGKYYTGVLMENFGQEKNGYLRVKIGERVGYMDKRYLVPYNSTDASAIPVTTIQNNGGSGGNLRKSPSLDGKLYALYPNGTEVAVLGVTPNGWCHVMINGVTGFMMADKLADSFSFDAPVNDARPSATYDDQESTLIPSSSIPEGVSLPEWIANPSDEQLSAYVKALASSDFIKADLSDAEWSISVCAGGYTVNATVDDMYTYAFVFLPDGQLAAYQSGTPIPPVSQELQPHDGFGDEIAMYALGFLDKVAPSVANNLEAFLLETLFDHEGVIVGSTQGITSSSVPGPMSTGAYFTVEIEPTLRLSSYRMESSILQHLWAQNNFSPAKEPEFRITREFPQQPNGNQHPELLSAEEVYPSVVNYLKTAYHETDESLRRFDVEYELMTEGQPYYWYFHLVTCEFYGDVLDDYQVKVDALTGEIIDAAAYEEANG